MLCQIQGFNPGFSPVLQAGRDEARARRHGAARGGCVAGPVPSIPGDAEQHCSSRCQPRAHSPGLLPAPLSAEAVPAADNLSGCFALPPPLPPVFFTAKRGFKLGDNTALTRGGLKSKSESFLSSPSRNLSW